MPTLAEIRKQHPEYDDLSDVQLADGLYKKFYADLPREEFDKKIGYSKPSQLESVGRGAVDTLSFGFDDEIAAGVRTGGGLWGDFSKDLEETRRRKQTAQEANPVEFFGGQAAGVVPSMLIPGGAVVRGVTTGSKVLRGGLAGALQGGAYGTGSADGDIGDRLSGALVGAGIGAVTGAAVPAVGSAIGKAIGGKAGRAAAPSTADIKAEAQALYAQAKQAGLVIAPQSFSDMVDKAVVTAHQAGARQAIQPKAYAAIEELVRAKQAVNSGQPMSLEEIDLLRQVATNVLSSNDSNERRIAGMILGQIDDFVSNLKPTDVVAGDAKMGAEALTKARALWAQKSKSEIVDRIFFKAENAVGANYTSAGMQTALRQKFRQLADNESLFRKFSPEEQQAILQVVRGGPIENGLRFIGKFAPSGFLTGMGTAGVAAVGGLPLAAAYTGATLGAKKAATAAGQRKADLAAALVRSGGKQPFDAKKAAEVEMLTNALLGTGARGSLPVMLDIERSITGQR